MAASSGRCCLGNLRRWFCAVNRPRGLAVVTSGVWCRFHHAAPRPGNQVFPSSAAVLSQLSPGLTLQPDFITAEEEAALCRELEPVLRKKRYESGHWDDAIHGFREVERLHWSPDSSAVIQRVRDKAFPPGENQLSLVHVLDLQKDGYIKPHVDSVKFCGGTIAGICLLSSSVMRLVSVENGEERADLLLPRHCLYIMSWLAATSLRNNVITTSKLIKRRDVHVVGGVARYKFTHEILRGEESFFNGMPVPRDRRISVICRNLPVS